jgi:predicted dehydrogenase
VTAPAVPGYAPAPPAEPLGIGILGCGWIAQSAHIPGYVQYGLPIAGVYDIDPEIAARAVRDHGVRAYASAAELLADPAVDVVDVAARTEDRAPLVRQALEAGKHVLSQKPFANDVAEAESLVDLAASLGLTIAVNQNGRWAPSWRIATRWLQDGVVGELSSIAHEFETSFAWTAERHFNDQAHFALYDYCAHWFDITRCWLAGKHVVEVRASDMRAPAQTAAEKTPWNMHAEIRCADGTLATIHGTGAARVEVPPRHLFSLVGASGTIRGTVLDEESVELFTTTDTLSVRPKASWFPDGFAGTMAELQSALADKREPYNSGRHVLDSLRLSEAAVRSAESGKPVTLDLPLR